MSALRRRLAHVNTVNSPEYAREAGACPNRQFSATECPGGAIIRQSASRVAPRNRESHDHRGPTPVEFAPNRAVAGRRSAAMERGATLGLLFLAGTDQEVRGGQITRRLRCPGRR